MATITQRRDLHGVMRSSGAVLAFLSLASAGCRAVGAHGAVPNGTPSAQTGAAANPNMGCQLPVSQRTSDAGCWLTVETSLGELRGGPFYWHLYEYSTSTAAEAARGPRGTVTESFGKHWLFAIEAEDWRPAAGERVAVIGPLSVKQATRYTARYMEAVFPADAQPPRVGQAGHRHSGAEAWYLLTGAQCLETPAGPMVVRAGEGAMVPEGPPMAISGVGPDTRRSVLLVMHPTAEPWVSRAPDFTVRGLCPK